PSATEHQSEPSTPTLFASVPTLTSTPSHVPSATDYGTIFTSTPPSSSPTSSTFLPSRARLATKDQPEPESASTPPIAPSSLILLLTHSPSSSSTDDVPKIASTPHSSSVLLTSFEYLPSAMVDQPEFEPEHVSLSSITPTSPSLPVTLSPDQSFKSLSLLSEALGQSPRSCGFESTPVRAANIVSPSSPELFESESLLYKTLPVMPASLEPSTTTPTSTILQQPPRLTTSGSISSALEVMPVFALSALIHEAPSTLVPRFSRTPTLRPQSGFSFAQFNFTLSLITISALVSALFNVSAALLTYTRKFQGKQDINDIWINTLKASSCDAFTHRLRLGQYTPHARRLVFDPGGQSSSSSIQASRLLSAREDIRQRKTMTRGGCTTADTNLPIPVPTDYLIVFDPGGVGSRLGNACRNRP
ncbi:hypothetical protein EDB85DRAFT_2230725, partial [Lactarius pseudohatsudake]